MKLINTLYLAVTCLIGVLAWNHVAPAFKPNGTTVISAARDVKGGQPVTVKVPSDLTSKQYKMLNFAYDVAKRDGHKHPPFLQGVLWQESKACNLRDFRVAGLQNKVGDRYFGCMQIKVAAAKDVLGRWPEMWKFFETRTDEELQARLILDDELNIRFGSKYLLLMGVNDNPGRAITSYNQGAGGAASLDAATWDYTVKVKQHSERFKKPEKVKVAGI